MSAPRPLQATAGDDELLARIRRGEVDALGELYDRHGRWMLARATAILHSRQDAEDVVHDAFVSLYERATQYTRERGSVGAWLGTLLRHRCIDLLRLGQRRGRLDRELVVHEPRVSAPSPEKEALDASQREDLWSAVAALPEAQRKTLESAFLEGLTYDEIAGRQHVPIGTVKSRANRAKASLRKAIE